MCTLNNLSEAFKWKWTKVFVWINVVRSSAVTKVNSNVPHRLWKRQYNQTGTHCALMKVRPNRRSFNNSAINSAANCALNENCCWKTFEPPTTGWSSCVSKWLCRTWTAKYRVIRNGCRGFNNLSYTSFSGMQTHVIISMGLRQGSGLCSSSSCKYPGTDGTNQNRHWNHHRWHATNSLERTRLSCWCL